MESTSDVVIVGGGPAGSAIAAACAARGLRVTGIDPDPDARWRPTYAAWADEVDVPYDTVWAAVEVRPDAGDVVRIERPYGRVDKDRLQDQLRAAPDVRWVRGTAGSVELDRVVDGTGADHRAAAVIDARGASAATRFQTAFGIRAVATRGPAGSRPDAATWMDFSFPFGDGTEVPSFLYALPLADGSTLFEETALVRGPAVPIELLRERLRRRLIATGVHLGSTIATEEVRIAMDVPIGAPTAPARYGAAAGMVHPATGFQLGRALRTAPAVADALVTAIPSGPAAAAAAVWHATWPGDAVRRAHLFRYGASALAAFDAATTRAFFRTFFSMPRPFVDGYLADTLSTDALVRGMASLFGRLPGRLRWRLASRGEIRELVRAALAFAPRAIEPLIPLEER
ncbi:MAG: lycopene cyclase family protein [Myxococcota bacterium]